MNESTKQVKNTIENLLATHNLNYAGKGVFFTIFHPGDPESDESIVTYSAMSNGDFYLSKNAGLLLYKNNNDTITKFQREIMKLENETNWNFNHGSKENNLRADISLDAIDNSYNTLMSDSFPYLVLIDTDKGKKYYHYYSTDDDCFVSVKSN